MAQEHDLDTDAFGENVEDAYPLPTIVKIKGESIELREITVDMLPQMAAHVKSLGDPKDLVAADILTLLETRGAQMRDMVAFLINRPAAYVGGLNWKVYQRLVAAVLAEHADFFAQSVGLQLVQAGKSETATPAGTGSTRSPSSSDTDTPTPASTRSVSSTRTSRQPTDTITAND